MASPGRGHLYSGSETEIEHTQFPDDGQEPDLGKQTSREGRTESRHLNIFTRKAMIHWDVNVLQMSSTPNCEVFTKLKGLSV